MRTLVFSLVIAITGCANPSSMDGDLAMLPEKPDGGRCQPGSTAQCVCLGGSMGTQTCRASGASYGPCEGCGPEEADGPLPTLQDAGGSPCGDCDGCCMGSTCVQYASQSNTSCGQRGAMCASCGSKVCDTGTGTCVDSSGGCDAQTCAAGCCKMVNGMPTCFIDQPAACGTGGGACTACTYGVTCDNGCTSQIDGNAQFKVIVTQTKFYNTDVGGNCWDNYAGFGCAQPDPVVCFGYQQGSTVIEGCNTEQDDVPADGMGIDTVDWNETNGLCTSGGSPFLIPGSYFISGGKVRITVYDVDATNAWDVIGQAYILAQPNYYSAYEMSAFGREISTTFELR
jgi:hypothetical protein